MIQSASIDSFSLSTTVASLPLQRLFHPLLSVAISRCCCPPFHFAATSVPHQVSGWVHFTNKIRVCVCSSVSVCRVCGYLAGFHEKNHHHHSGGCHIQRPPAITRVVLCVCVCYLCVCVFIWMLICMYIVWPNYLKKTTHHFRKVVVANSRHHSATTSRYFGWLCAFVYVIVFLDA